MKAYELYLNQITEMLKRVLSEEGDLLEAAAHMIFDSLCKGGMLYTFGTGHAHLLAEELFYRAGGLVRVCPILDERLMLHLSASESTNWERREGVAAEVFSRYSVRRGDVMLVVSNSGRNAAPVEMALLAREAGVKVIALTSLQHSQNTTPHNSYGKRLFEVADLVLDNLSVEGDALLPRANGGRVGPTSTVVGAAILQSIVCRVQTLAEESGEPIDFFVSSNINGGDKINEHLITENREAICHL